jgi:hypothetical protein
MTNSDGRRQPNAAQKAADAHEQRKAVDLAALGPAPQERVTPGTCPVCREHFGRRLRGHTKGGCATLRATAHHFDVVAGEIE